MAELGPALFVFMLMLVFPLIDLMGVATGYATQALLTTHTAGRVASQMNYDSAINSMVQEANRMQSTGFAKFARMQPVGGFSASGSDLYVQATNFRTGAVNTIGPNTPVPPPVDTTLNVYEFSVKSVYDVGPWVNLHSVPFIGNVPGLGKPARLTFTATRAAEHPAGLDNGLGTLASLGNTSGVGVGTLDRTLVNTWAQKGAIDSGWNYPNIYQAISGAGQTVVIDQVLLVPAHSDWVPSGITVASSANVWIDTHAVGAWTDDALLVPFSADGIPVGALAQNLIDSNANLDSLIGCVGATPPCTAGGGPVTWPGMFYVGQTLSNYHVQGSGMLSFKMNDNTSASSLQAKGAQMVRIVVVQ